MRFNVLASRRARWGPMVVLLAAACVFGTASTRSAAHSIIPKLESVTPGSGAYVWLYSLTLDVSSTAKVGDFFEQADLVNMIPGSETTTPFTAYGVGTDALAGFGFTASWSPLPGPVFDSNGNPVTVWHISGTYPAVYVTKTSGPDVVGTGVPGNLGYYAFLSKSSGSFSIGGYGSDDHNTNLGTVQANVGLVQVPVVPVSGAHTAVIGLFGSTLFLLRMRKRS